jgi:hypothetical protein
LSCTCNRGQTPVLISGVKLPRQSKNRKKIATPRRSLDCVRKEYRTVQYSTVQYSIVQYSTQRARTYPSREWMFIQPSSEWMFMHPLVEWMFRQPSSEWMFMQPPPECRLQQPLARSWRGLCSLRRRWEFLHESSGVVDDALARGEAVVSYGGGASILGVEGCCCCCCCCCCGCGCGSCCLLSPGAIVVGVSRRTICNFTAVMRKRPAQATMTALAYKRIGLVLPICVVKGRGRGGGGGWRNPKVNLFKRDFESKKLPHTVRESA